MAVFCAGVRSTVGTDQVLLALIAGYCLDYDDRYQARTQEARMSETIDLLLNLTFYVFIGSVIAWSSFNSSAFNSQPWRLVAGTILLFVFRRLPVFTLLKPLIGDFRTMRQAVFYAHFGPIGGGTIFSALFIRAQLTPGSVKSTTGEASSPATEKFLDRLWAITTFVVVCSSAVHGSSIALSRFRRKLNWLGLVQRLEVKGDQEDDLETGKCKVQELCLENPDENAVASSTRKRRRHETRALETIFHDLEDGHRIIVEDQDGTRLKTFTIRRPSAASVAEPDRHQTGRGSTVLLEQRIPEVLLRRSSNQQILSYVPPQSRRANQGRQGKDTGEIVAASQWKVLATQCGSPPQGFPRRGPAPSTSPICSI